MTTSSPEREEWKKEFRKKFIDDIIGITGGGLEIYAEQIEDFISSLLSSLEAKHRKEMEEVKRKIDMIVPLFVPGTEILGRTDWPELITKDEVRIILNDQR